MQSVEETKDTRNRTRNSNGKSREQAEDLGLCREKALEREDTIRLGIIAALILGVIALFLGYAIWTQESRIAYYLFTVVVGLIAGAGLSAIFSGDRKS